MALRRLPSVGRGASPYLSPSVLWPLLPYGELSDSYPESRMDQFHCGTLP